MKQKLKELVCLIFGHKWESSFDPKIEETKTIDKRTYCKRCGIKYHIHEYK